MYVRWWIITGGWSDWRAGGIPDTLELSPGYGNFYVVEDVAELGGGDWPRDGGPPQGGLGLVIEEWTI